MSISKVSSFVINKVGKIGAKGGKKGLIKKLSSPQMAGAAATIILLSTTSKDIVSTYYYVTQSLKNKRIPEEKRKFVAALDLANGIMNATFGVALGWGLNKWAKHSFDKKYTTFFEPNNMRQLLEKHKDLSALKKIDIAHLTDEAIEIGSKQTKGICRGGLVAIATLVGSQIIGKRVITPLFATPMASWFKNKMEKTTGVPNTPELERIVDTRMPKTMDAFKRDYLGTSQG